jgi:hypothetical protein
VTTARIGLLLLAAAMFAACGTAAAQTATGSTRQPLAAGLPPASAVQPPLAAALGHLAAALPSPTPLAAPTSIAVTFSHLPPGNYQVHLHAICSGQQGYHLAYLPNLVVGAGHAGQIQVPAGDFGRAWCVIVYSDAVHSIVLTTQRI